MTHMVKKIILDNWTQTIWVYPTCVKRATCKASVWKCLSPGRPWCSDAVLLTILPPCTCTHNYNSKHLKHNIGFCVGLYLPFPTLFFICSAFFLFSFYYYYYYYCSVLNFKPMAMQISCLLKDFWKSECQKRFTCSAWVCVSSAKKSLLMHNQHLSPAPQWHLKRLPWQPE